MPLDSYIPDWFWPGRIRPEAGPEARDVAQQMGSDATSALGRLGRLPVAYGLVGGFPGVVAGLAHEALLGFLPPKADRATNIALAVGPQPLAVRPFKGDVSDFVDSFYAEQGRIADRLRREVGGEAADKFEALAGNALADFDSILASENPAAAAQQRLNAAEASVTRRGQAEAGRRVRSIDAPITGEESEIGTVGETIPNAPIAVQAPSYARVEQATPYVPTGTERFSTATRAHVLDDMIQLRDQLVSDKPYVRRKARELMLARNPEISGGRHLDRIIIGVRNELTQVGKEGPQFVNQSQSLMRDMAQARLSPLEQAIVRGVDLHKESYRSLEGRLARQYGRNLKKSQIGEIYKAAKAKLTPR